MSSLCCCWRQQAAAKDGTDAAASEMEPVEVPRAGESDRDCREAAMEPMKLDDMVDEWRVSHCAVTDGADAADEDERLEDNQRECHGDAAGESDSEFNKQGAERLENGSNYDEIFRELCPPTNVGWTDDRRPFYDLLVARINVRRARMAVMQPLRLSEDLCHVARDIWLGRWFTLDGFFGIPRCEISSDVTGTTRWYDCLTYCDMPDTELSNLSIMACGYWIQEAPLIALVDTNGNVEAFYPDPVVNKNANRLLEHNRQYIKPVLLNESHSRIGLFVNRGPFVRNFKKKRYYCVIAVFVPEEGYKVFDSPDNTEDMLSLLG